VKLLLQLGADPSLEDAMGKMPIHYLTSKNETIIKSLKRMLNRKTSRAQWINEGEGQNQSSSP